MSDITKVYGACPHDCPDTCGVITEVENGRAVKFYGDPDNKITDGWLCAKVRPYLDHVYHPDRLTHPLRRTNSKTEKATWAQISWDEAIKTITDRWQKIIAEHGAEAILPYSFSGTLGMLHMEVVSGRFWNRMGASQLERSICGAAGETGVNLTVGARRGIPYDAVMHSKTVLIWGHNPVSTAPHFMPWLKKAQKNGTTVIVIDPRRTRTAKGADWHLMPKPGTDGALALGLAQIIITSGWHDEAWLEANTVGWPKFRAHVAQYTAEKTADTTGISVADLQKLAQLYAQNTPSILKFADGVQRHKNGGQTVRALASLPALIGQYGVLGGGLGYSASGYLQWDGETANKWGEIAHPPTRIVNMNRLGAALTGEIQDPPLQSLYVFGANPMAATPNVNLIRQGLEREDMFTVVHDLFMTDTAEMADIVLPAAGQLEKIDLHRAYGHTQITLNEPAIPPLGECKSDWDVMRLLATGMGYNDPWLQEDGEAIVADMLLATAETYPALKGVTLKKMRTAKSAIPVAHDTGIPFADLQFLTPSGKVELYSEQAIAHGIDPLPTYYPAVDETAGEEDGFSLNLISGAAHHFVTTSFGNSQKMIAREGEPFIEIHPDDAAVRQITHGARVEVSNQRGSIPLKAVVTDGVRRGVVVSPKGRWSNLSGGHNINVLTPDATADLAGQSTYHTNRVWVKPL